MKKEDFKQITKEHIIVCEKIISQKGICKNLDCSTCPFDRENSTCNRSCLRGYGNGEISVFDHDPKLEESAKEFVKNFGGK